MYDVWDVIGLRGTGTDSYSVDNLFIPDKFAALRDDPSALRENGPLYKLSTNMVFSIGFAATSLGVARATLDAATDLARGKTPQGLKAMRDNNAVQGLIGRTEATLRAARAYLYHGGGSLARSGARRRHSPSSIASRCGSPRPGPSINRPRRRHRLSHGRRDRGLQRQQVRTAFSRHARHRAADPGPRYPLRGCRQGDTVRRSRHAADGALMGIARKNGRNESCKKQPAKNPASAVEAVFDAYPKPVRAKLLALRRLISTPRKPPRRRRAGRDVEMGAAELSHGGDQERQHDPDRSGQAGAGQYRSTSIARPIWSRTFRELYPELRYEGNRAILLGAETRCPKPSSPLRGAGANVSSGETEAQEAKWHSGAPSYVDEVRFCAEPGEVFDGACRCEA